MQRYNALRDRSFYSFVSHNNMPTRNPHNRILALHPAKRSLGICVMERRGTQRQEILVAGVKTFRGEGKAMQARDYVAGLLRDVEPSVLVMEERTGEHGGQGAGERRGRGARRTEERRISRPEETFADKLYEFIGKAAKGSNVKLRLYSSRHVKQSLCGDEQATWHQVSQAVAEQYGELRGCLCINGSEKEKYWRGMFEAVALGMV
jgi:hypothetical protein